jgi:large subunit ribosomal protein L19
MEERIVLPAVRAFEASQMKNNIPYFKAGDSLRLHLRIVEGERSRIQVFEGVCIGRSGSGFRETVTVRRTSYGLGMERILPLHSPVVEKIDVVRHGRVRQGKLYYLRNLTGKKARITEASREAIKKKMKKTESILEEQAAEETPARMDAVAEEPALVEASFEAAEESNVDG